MLLELFSEYDSALRDAHSIELFYHAGDKIAVNKDERATAWQELDKKTTELYKRLRYELAALEAENEKLRNPWTTIVPGDAGTLPPDNTHVALSIYSYGVDDDGKPFEFKNVIKARHTPEWGGWISNHDIAEMKERVLPGGSVQTIIAYAWTDWPQPAPYPGTNTPAAPVGPDGGE